jgi:hypothetical protein
VCCVLFERGNILCDMCIFVCCLRVVPLSPGINPFVVQLNNNVIIIIIILIIIIKLEVIFMNIVNPKRRQIHIPMGFIWGTR